MPDEDKTFSRFENWMTSHAHTLFPNRRRHVWVEFVVGSRPCSEGFSPDSPVFFPPQKSTLLNSNSVQRQWMMTHFVKTPLQIPIIIIIIIIIIIVIIIIISISISIIIIIIIIITSLLGLYDHRVGTC